MNRRSIPAYGMHEAGPEHLRRRGFVATPIMVSVRLDPRRTAPHFHEFYQLYLLQGRATVMLDFQEFEAVGNTAVFVSPGQVHQLRPGADLQGVMVSFTQLFFDDEAPPPSRLLELPYFYSVGADPWVRLKGAAATEIISLFASLCKEFEQALPDAAQILQATLRLLLFRLARLHSAVSPQGRPTRALLLVRQFHTELEKHFRQETEVGAYARMLGVTANHLNDVIREQTGGAAGDFIRRRRLLDAKRMLFHSKMNVSEIAYELGFADASYFSRFFRRYEGETPSEFLLRFREKQ